MELRNQPYIVWSIQTFVVADLTRGVLFRARLAIDHLKGGV